MTRRSKVKAKSKTKQDDLFVGMVLPYSVTSFFRFSFYSGPTDKFDNKIYGPCTKLQSRALGNAQQEIHFIPNQQFHTNRQKYSPAITSKILPNPRKLRA